MGSRTRRPTGRPRNNPATISTTTAVARIDAFRLSRTIWSLSSAATWSYENAPNGPAFSCRRDTVAELRLAVASGEPE
jgi:hypothetical protein